MLNWVDIHNGTEGCERTLNEKLSYLSRIIIVFRQIIGVKRFIVPILGFFWVFQDFSFENNYPNVVVQNQTQEWNKVVFEKIDQILDVNIPSQILKLLYTLIGTFLIDT